MISKNVAYIIFIIGVVAIIFSAGLYLHVMGKDDARTLTVGKNMIEITMPAVTVNGNQLSALSPSENLLLTGHDLIILLNPEGSIKWVQVTYTFSSFTDWPSAGGYMVSDDH